MDRARLVSTMMLALFVGCSLRVQARQSVSSEPNNSSTPITAGQETFRAYCASCHGMDGKGDGPAAAALTEKLPDLTRLGDRGAFPMAMIESVIRGDQSVVAHGTREMPIWGQAFRNTNGDQALAKIKIHNLALYLASIQQK